MKKISNIILSSFLVCAFFTTSNAQVKVNLNINILPDWGPAEVEEVDYYYMPEYDIYYYAPKKQFVYLSGSNWVFAYELPSKYRNVNLYSTYKVVINEPKPYLRHNYYVVKYKGYKNGHYKQMNRRDFEKEKHEKKEKHKNKKHDD
jgi:hypothetical protein